MSSLAQIQPMGKIRSTVKLIAPKLFHNETILPSNGRCCGWPYRLLYRRLHGHNFRFVDHRAAIAESLCEIGPSATPKRGKPLMEIQQQLTEKKKKVMPHSSRWKKFVWMALDTMWYGKKKDDGANFQNAPILRTYIAPNAV
mgnify:CR=1 FL=1